MKLKAPDAAAATARPPVNWFLSICLVALTIISTSAAANAQTGAEGLNPAEKWVIAQATAGEMADLSKKFPEEKDRKLSAHFLEDLLTGMLSGVKLHRHGVQITGATIDEPIDLTNAQIPHAVWLFHCQFNSRASFRNVNFAGELLLDRSTFKALANFNSMKVGDAAFFKDAVFEGPVNFGQAEIARNFEANKAQFQDKEKEANFNSMKVGHSAFFNDAVFEGPVNFGSAEIASVFDANGAKFQNKEKEANFNSMKVGHTAE